MRNKKLNIAVCLTDDKFSPCVRYVFDLFAKVHGHNCRAIETHDDPTPADITIRYVPESTLSEPSSSPTIVINRGAFFGGDFGKTSLPPQALQQLAAAATETAFSSLIRSESHSALLPADMIASAFYMLSGYHDWVDKDRDADGRVLASHFKLAPETWDRPVVNHWFRQLDELIQSVLRGETETIKAAPRPPAPHTICLTHDVDLMRKYRPGSAFRRIARAVKNGPATAVSEAKTAGSVISGRNRDPYDSFDQLYTVKERVSAPSTFFFLGSKPGGHNGDYDIAGHEARNLMTRARAFNDEIAMHGSWASKDDKDVFQEEKDRIEKSSRTSIQGSRQHYLRFETPATWRHLTEAGLRYDSTGGFPDRCGFKYGWSGCFQPFDLDNMRPIPIIEIPLVCMDVTLATYEKIPAELTLERMTNLLDAACENVPGGAFVFLWHNIMADRKVYPGYWDTFEYFFSVASGSARYITLSQLCGEFESVQQ